MNQNEQNLPLVDVLQQCNQEGKSPSTNYQVWLECLQEVFQSLGYQNTAADFVSAINQVWGQQVTEQIMLTAVTTLVNASGGYPFASTVVQTLIDGLLATFLIRDNLNDVGGQSEAPFWSSPDIINYGTNTLTVAAAISMQSEYITCQFNNGQQNNMYIRARNISNSPASGYVSLYSVPSSLLMSPQSWLPFEMGYPSSAENFYDQSNSQQIQPGEMCLNTTPFNYAGIPSGGHFCLVAVASGANGMPFDIPQSFPSNAALASWVQNNPNVSQRNMDYGFVTGNTGTMYVTIGNNNNIASNFIITITPENSNKLPEGTIVSASITDVRAPYSPPPQQWSPEGISFPEFTVPANIDGSPQNPLINISLYIELPQGSSFSDSAPIMVNYYQVPSATPDQLELTMLSMHQIPGGANVMADTVEESSLLLLGSCSFIF